MTIEEMHIMFRQYAQQMGMQNVRAILPEQIDLLLNNSISDIINQIIRENIGMTNDRIITDNSKIGQINALRSLYKIKEINYSTSYSNGISGTFNTYSINLDNIKEPNISLSPSVSDTPEEDEEESNANEAPSITIPDTDMPNIDVPTVNEKTIKFLFIVDLSINFKKTGSTNVTNLFPVRIIDDAYLSDTLNDFILKPRVRTPVAIIYNNIIKIYIDSSELTAYSLSPNIFRLSYIASPNKVQYAKDVGGSNVDCNLPDYLHGDIVKHAVDLYNIALTGSLLTAQQQQKRQQQEDARNNARPNNEGYQQRQQ